MAKVTKHKPVDALLAQFVDPAVLAVYVQQCHVGQYTYDRDHAGFTGTHEEYVRRMWVQMQATYDGSFELFVAQSYVMAQAYQEALKDALGIA